MIIKNARVISSKQVFQSDVFFSAKSGKIEVVAEDVQKRGEEVFDAEGMLLLPGAVDLHVHLRDPGFTQKEDFFTGSRAAVAGGVTTVCDMPNNLPPTDSLEALAAKKEIAKEKAVCDYMLFFAAHFQNLGEVQEAFDSRGVAGAKVFMGPTTQAAAGFPKKIFSLFNRLVAVHAEDEQTIAANEQAAAKGLKGEASIFHHNKIRPPKAASKAVGEALAAAEESGGRLHVCHASTEKEIELIAAAKKRGVRVSCEATPHHLFLNEQDALKRGNLLKVNPPLRSEEDRKALWKAVLDGVVDCVTSDHAPHLLQEKNGEYWKAPAGVPGVETTLPLLLNEALEERISLNAVARLLCENPAKIVGLEGKKGLIERGCDADFVLVNPEKRLTLKSSLIYSKCAWTPFEGRRVRGKIEKVFVRGREAFDGKRVAALQGSGRPADQ